MAAATNGKRKAEAARRMASATDRINAVLLAGQAITASTPANALQYSHVQRVPGTQDVLNSAIAARQCQ